jgi:hypothetical protein
VRTFAAIMTQRHGHRLGEWLAHAKQLTLPCINRCVNGVTADLDAVTAGVSLPCVELARGRIWLGDDVERWLEQREARRRAR